MFVSANLNYIFCTMKLSLLRRVSNAFYNAHYINYSGILRPAPPNDNKIQCFGKLDYLHKFDLCAGLCVYRRKGNFAYI